MPKDYGTNRIKRSGTFLILLSMIILSLVLSGCSSSGELTWAISGTITSGGSPIAGVTVTLSNGPSSGVTTTDANGNYGFGGLTSGTYIITPSLAGYTFVPSSRPAYLYGNNAEGFNFSASRGLSGSASNHTLYLQSDGTVRAWGLNNKGQLGNGNTTNSALHVTVTGLTNVTNVAAGNEHSLALKSDGTVWAWGSNSNGQLGDNSTTNSGTPVQVRGLANVTAIAAGVNFSLALKSDATIWAWGYNGSGQLGDTSTTDRWSPVQVSGLTSIAAIAAGFDHAVALTSGGAVWTWGNNSKGQLGNGSTTSSSTPLLASSSILGNATMAISAGNQFSVALLRNYLSSYVWAWGSNSSGQLGDGTNADRWAPVQVSGIAGMTAIAAGENHAISLKGDGTVWAWGSNSNGQLGDNSTTDRWTPVQVNTLTGGQGVAAGYQDSFASTTIGTVWAWGDNVYGQLGDGSYADRWTPVPITLP